MLNTNASKFIGIIALIEAGTNKIYRPLKESKGVF
jgi:hypothetical protein